MKIVVRILVFLVLVVVFAGGIAYLDGSTLAGQPLPSRSLGSSRPRRQGLLPHYRCRQRRLLASRGQIRHHADPRRWPRRQGGSLDRRPGTRAEDDLPRHPHRRAPSPRRPARRPQRHLRRHLDLRDLPGPTPGATTLHITEAGFIHPPIYRFIMAHVFGPTHNLDVYMSNIQAAATKS